MFKHSPELNLLNFDAEIAPYDPQHFRAEFESITGQKIWAVVSSRDARLIAAVATRHRQPVVPELEPFIRAAAGPEAFERRFKQFTGHAVAHVVASMGGKIARTGVDVTIPDSRYVRATRYEPAA